MNKVRDIIRYGQTTDLSERQIARALGISRTVVARTLQTFRASGLDYLAVDQLPDSELQENLERGRTPQDVDFLNSQIHDERRRAELTE